MLNLEMKLEGKVTSTNQIYKRGRNGGVYICPEVKEYRKRVGEVVKRYYKQSPHKYTGGPIRMTAWIHANYFNKGGTVKRMDVDNFAKNLLDTIFPALKIDDKMVFELRLIKKQKKRGEPYVRVRIKEFTK